MINFTNLLAGESTPASNSSSILMWVMLGIVVVFFVVTQIFSVKKNKARQQEREDHLKTIAVGDYVLTIGMIYGQVISINNDNSTVVLETGDDEHKGYVCVFMSAIHSFSKESIILDPFGQVVTNDTNTADVFDDMKTEDEANAETQVENVDTVETAESTETTEIVENTEAVSDDTAIVKDSTEVEPKEKQD